MWPVVNRLKSDAMRAASQRSPAVGLAFEPIANRLPVYNRPHMHEGDA